MDILTSIVGRTAKASLENAQSTNRNSVKEGPAETSSEHNEASVTGTSSEESFVAGFVNQPVENERAIREAASFVSEETDTNLRKTAERDGLPVIGETPNKMALALPSSQTTPAVPGVSQGAASPELSAASLLDSVDEGLSDAGGIEAAYSERASEGGRIGVAALTSSNEQALPQVSRNLNAPSTEIFSSISPLSASNISDLGLGGSEDLVGKISNADGITLDKFATTVQPGMAATPTTQASATAQVIAAIKVDNAGDDIEVRLDPPEMGRVRLSFSLDGTDAVKAVLTAEHGQTLDYLRKHSEELIKALDEAGFDAIDLTFSDDAASFSAERDGLGEGIAEHLPQHLEEHADMIYLSLRDDVQVDVLV